MYSIKKLYLGLAITTLCFIVAACGPSPEDLAATALALTASAATNTPIPSSTPTSTSVPTSTQVPTSTPVPDPGVFITHADLDIPTSYIIIPPINVGMQPGEFAYYYTKPNGTERNQPIIGSFYFINEDDDELVYGFSVHLESIEKTIFDNGIDFNIGMEYPQDCRPNEPFIEVKPMPVIAEFGVGVVFRAARTICATSNSSLLLLWDRIAIRRGEIGVIVHTLYYEDSDQIGRSVDLIAQRYLDRIHNPKLYNCKFTSILPDEEAVWPTFEYWAEGFVPLEPRIIKLEGDVVIGETSMKTGTYALGQTGETADESGVISGYIMFGPVFGDDITQPSELVLTVIGTYSNCEIIENLTWP